MSSGSTCSPLDLNQALYRVREARFLRKSSKTPQVSAIIEVRTHPHYSRTRGLSSECYSPKKTRRTQEEILPGRAAADQETAGQYHRTRAARAHDDRHQYPL